MDIQPLLSTHDAAEFLNMTPVQVTRAARRGDIPCVMLHDGEPRFDVKDLRQWVESQKQPPRQGAAQ